MINLTSIFRKPLGKKDNETEINIKIGEKGEKSTDIEVFDIEQADPLGITLKLQEEHNIEG